MKKLLFVIASAAIILSSACSKKAEEKLAQVNTENKELSKQLAVAQDSKDSLIVIMNDIYTGIEEINMQEELLYNIRGNGDQAMQRQTIMENLAKIRQQLKEKQDLLDKYSANLNDANDQNKFLRNQVATLQDRIAKQDAKVTELTSQVESLRAENGELKEDLAITQEEVRNVTSVKDSLANVTATQDTQLKQNEMEMNTVYYCMGSKKELKNNQILVKGKVLRNNFNQSYFKAVDKRNIKSIPCNNKKAEILSSQPTSSYHFEVGANKHKTLVIDNPESFWNASRYLVIKVG